MSRITSFFLCIFGIFLFLFLGVLALSWYSVNRLIHRHEFVVYGRKTSEIACELREQLLKRPDTRAVHFITSDRVQLAGLLVNRQNAQSNVIIAHGYLMTKEAHHHFLTIFPESNVLLFDFRSHGQSEGSLISLGYHEAKDIRAAVEFMQEEQSRVEDRTLPIVLVGISMGGAAALRAVSQDASLCDALVIDSTYSSLRKTMDNSLSHKTGLPSFPFYTVMAQFFRYYTSCRVDDMDIAECVKQIQHPILFMHSQDDFFVRPEHSVELYNHAKNDQSKLCIGPRCRHGFLSGHYPEWYQKKVVKFLLRSLTS